MARFNAARRESVWINTDIRKTAAFKALSDSAFGLWTRLPFLADDDHMLPELAIIAKDGRVSIHEAARLMGELVTVGLVEPMRGDLARLTPLSQQYYSFTDPEAETVDEDK